MQFRDKIESTKQIEINGRENIMSVLKITRENFEKEVLQSDKPVLLDFWAPWCGPCRMVGPIVEQVAEETVGTARVGKINVDEEPELAQNFRVMSIPTLVVMKDGEVVKSAVGAQSKQALLSMIQ
jgi:thioredoxin 1